MTGKTKRYRKNTFVDIDSNALAAQKGHEW